MAIKNLAFKGGGVLGIAYAGAIQVLEQKGVLKTVERVAGTSAGAITAALVALKYNSAEITQIVNATNFKNFQDSPRPLKALKYYGLYQGDFFLQWMQQKLTAKGLKANATFNDLKKAGYLDLHVFATDLNTKSLKKFSVADTPNVLVAEAVRASMSIPLFFKAWTFSNGIPDKHIYVDGGMVYNFPITIFDQGAQPNPETLGLFLTSLNPVPVNSLTYDEFGKYMGILVQTMLDTQVINFMNDPASKKRSVIIDNLGISPTHFSLSDQQKKDLFNSGVKYATDYLKANPVV